MQFSFIEKKTKNLFYDFYDKVLKIPLCVSRFDDALTDVGMGQFTTTMDYYNLK